MYLANRWAEISLQKYQERWTYASRVQLLYYEMKQIEQCRGPFRVYSMYENLCSRIGTLAGLDRQLQSMAEEVREAEKEANGIIANYDFSLKEAAPVPQKPLSYNPNTFILAGRWIGLLVSILIWDARPGIDMSEKTLRIRKFFPFRAGASPGLVFQAPAPTDQFPPSQS